MRFCLVEIPGHAGPRLCVEKGTDLVVLDAPPSVRQALDALGSTGLMNLAKKASGSTVAQSKVTRWLPPVPDPRVYRDFYGFEQHVKAARARRGQEMIPEWYKIPIFYFSNPTAFFGHNEAIKKPESTNELDWELEIACIIGERARDLTEKNAEDAIFGYAVLNDWSARDLQREEMKCMLGPAKGKDFANSLGPWVVTKDELADRREAPGKYNLTMIGRRNGKEVSRSNMNTLYYTFAQMLVRGSRDVWLHPGDVCGSGTCGTGCILELGPENVGGWVKPGDVLEMEIERLGTLRTPVE